MEFVIDKLTNSIENTTTGEVFDTEIIRLGEQDIKYIKKAEWQFNWSKEIRDKDKEVYKLTTVNNAEIIQGLLSIEDKQDHIFMHLIESASFNKKKTKCILAFQAILSRMPARFQLRRVMKGLLHLMQSLH